jgi:hypothetical protein
MEKLLIHFDQKAYDKKVKGLETFSQLFQNCIVSYNSFGYAKFKKEDLFELFLNTDNYVFEQIIQGKTLSLGGVPISKAKLFDIVEKPKGYSALKNSIDQIERIFNNSKESYGLTEFKQLVNLFTLDEDYRIAVRQSLYDDYKNQYETYITSDAAKSTFNFAKELLELYSKYNLKFVSLSDHQFLFRDLLKFDGENILININHVSLIDRRNS